MQSPHVGPQRLLKATCRPGAKVFSGVHTQRRASTRIYQAGKDKQSTSLLEELTGLGDGLGPIGITVGGPVKKEDDKKTTKSQNSSTADADRGLADKAGISLGPISLIYGDDFAEGRPSSSGSNGSEQEDSGPGPQSISSMTTAEWRAKYEKDGCVDLWVEEEFNSGSRLVGGRAVHMGGTYGIRTGEGPSLGEVPAHTVTIYNHHVDQVITVEVPEDRYIMWEAEEQGLEVPYACRMGCCTVCAVRIKEGEMWQPEALGISQELKEQGYGLMCVGFPMSDCVLETITEDEIYDLQFGRMFEEVATDPNNALVLRDDIALELALGDE